MSRRKTWLQLQRARERAGYSLKDLALKVGCTPSHLSLVESGKRGMGPELQAAVARTLGIPIDELIYSAPDVPPRTDTTERLAS